MLGVVRSSSRPCCFITPASSLKFSGCRVRVAPKERRLGEALDDGLRGADVRKQHELLHHLVGADWHVQPHADEVCARPRSQTALVHVELDLRRREAQRAAGVRRSRSL